MGAKTHGLSGTPTYISWQKMRARCSNPNAPHYDRYGGRGIKVCKRWAFFKNFLKDMGIRPDGLTLDRKNNNKDYSKVNCKWSTQTEQTNNRSSNLIIRYKGKTQTSAQWHKELGFSGCNDAIGQRLRRGWSIEKALETPI